MPKSPTPSKLYLVLPALPDAQTLLDLAKACLNLGCLGALLLKSENKATQSTKTLRKTVISLQALGIATLIENDVGLARSVGADGVHLDYAPNYLKQYATARKELGTKLIVGAEIKSSRHEAMCLGEKGADYIAFGKDLKINNKQVAHLEQQELVAWWAELFEVPSVALDIETPLEAKTMSEAGADFIAIKLPQEITLKTVEKFLAPFVAALRS